MEAVILMNNNEVIIIYKEVGKQPILQKITNDMSSFKKLLGRRNSVYIL